MTATQLYFEGAVHQTSELTKDKFNQQNLEVLGTLYFL